MATNKKGLSPLIASVLLVAFTMAVAAIVVAWITGFVQQQTNTVGSRGENQVKCGYSILSIDKNEVSVVGNALNVTVTYSAGTETLNITGFSVRDANGNTYVNTTSLSSLAYNETKNMAVGSQIKFVNYILTGSVQSGVAWSEVRVTGLCQNQFAVTSTVRPS
ncbi:MAG: archaellin/type IV pilin N-terminal domain-containing protein [Candidatus Aenigmatarchaeota archaeon]